jgi:protein-S-isoprenylcysteine O-methyltransferase Ste14
MEHLLFRQITCAVFLLLLGGARYYFAFAGPQSADRPSSPVNWARHIPAYFTSTVWTVYVAWLVLFPQPLAGWDSWPLSHRGSEFLGWVGVPFLGAGFLLFCYSHYTIGQYWSIRVQIKKAHRLVTKGPYGYVRHPLYTSLFLGYLGTLLVLQSWALTAWFPAFVASYLVFAREEESVMARGFGEAYRSYRQQTGMFLPRWTRIRADASRLPVWWRARSLGAQRTRDSD